MPKPTVTEHRTDIRAILAELTASQFTDQEIDGALNVALYTLSSYYPNVQSITKSGLNPADTTIDLSTDCPASAVTEITAGAATHTEMRARGASVILSKPIGATSATIYFKTRYAHNGSETDHYPQQYRAGVVMLAAAICLYGREREIAETNPMSANALAAPAARLWDTAINIITMRAPAITRPY